MIFYSKSDFSIFVFLSAFITSLTYYIINPWRVSAVLLASTASAFI
jgi:hypothetical protein